MSSRCFVTLLLLILAAVVLTHGAKPRARPRLPARGLREYARKKRQLYNTGSQFVSQPNIGVFGFNRRTSYQNWLACKQDPGCDPRSIEDWWNLYPFGRKALDQDLLKLINRETQITLGFDFPFYGFRFNYTQVWPNGFISFAFPAPIMPPYEFPNPRWPTERDWSFIAPFYAEAAFQYVANTRISNVWYRTVHRPSVENPSWNANGGINNAAGSGIGYEQGDYSGSVNAMNTGRYGSGQGGNPNYNSYSPNRNNYGSGSVSGGTGGNVLADIGENYGRKKRQIPKFSQVGDVIDEWLLDNITRDIQEAYNGAQGWRAEHALVATWERMAYGGARKHVDVSTFDQVLQWQNTFQLVLATDQIRTFCMFNYAQLNWTTSNAAGGLNGFGGFQPALVGFNGGNGTGFTPLPYSGKGRVWMLSYFSSGLVPGRWVYRVDEQMLRGGCSNRSTGFLVQSPPMGVMVGGIAVNISGPCLRPNDQVKVIFDEWPVDCVKVNRFRARCIMPPFHKTGLVNLRMSRDGGQSYPYIGWFYVQPANRAPSQVFLRDDPLRRNNSWTNPEADELTMSWQWLNLTNRMDARVDVNLYGYWEDAFRSHFDKIDTIGKQQSNNGLYTFHPKQLIRDPQFKDAWKKYHFGMIQVAVSDVGAATDLNTHHGVLWSRPVPFGWYHLPYWQKHRGSNWATDMCIDWYEYDGKRRNFIMEILNHCPCRLEQAKLDLGRFMPLFQCDMDGNKECNFHKGALHCVQSTDVSFAGAGQGCCYDENGFLMFSDDWEPYSQLSKFFQPGTPSRAHMFSSHPFTRNPPRIPTFSHYTLDLMPYYMCCKYADRCEFYYWRRQTNGCQNYKPPGAAYSYGLGHFRTFDGIEYPFPGKGYFVLAMDEDPEHKLMIQVRMEQPDKTVYGTFPNATVITGIAIKENNSDVVQVFARKPFRRWRYKTDVYVGGIRRFFDMPPWKYQQFTGVSIRNPQLNMNQSTIIVILKSGAAVQVQESYGMLDVMVSLPPEFNSTCDQTNLYRGPDQTYNAAGNRNRPCYITEGLLGAWNGNPVDDLRNLDGSTVGVSLNQDLYTQGTAASIYQQFGEKWRVDPNNRRIGPLLFQSWFQPLYNPLLFVSPNYWPQFYTENMNPTNLAMLPTTGMVFTPDMVKAKCQQNKRCIFDYYMTGRSEVGVNSIDLQKKFLSSQETGTKRHISCGPLYKTAGVVKSPPRRGYMDGDRVRFGCRAGYFIHGSMERTCINGTWSGGWWAWCRNRSLEYGLKWMTGILVVIAVIIIIIAVFCVLYRRRVRINKGRVYRQGNPVVVAERKKEPPREKEYKQEKSPPPRPSPPPMAREPLLSKPPPRYSPSSPASTDSFDQEPTRVGLAGNGKTLPVFTELSV